MRREEIGGGHRRWASWPKLTHALVRCSLTCQCRGLVCLRIGSARLFYCLADESLDIGRRHAGNRSGFGLAVLKQSLRDVVPVPRALLVGMARAHRIAAIVEDQSSEDRRRPASGQLEQPARQVLSGRHRITLDGGSAHARSCGTRRDRRSRQYRSGS
jgi:hypothetical protein